MMKTGSSIAAIALSLFAVACGGSSASKTSAGATIEGTVVTQASSLTVSAAGAPGSSQTDAAGHFALLNVPAGTSSLHFSGGGVDATLPISALSEREHRSIHVDVSGHDASEHHEQSEARQFGAIASITAPSFVIGSRTILTTTATVFSRGPVAIAFADLTIGTAVEVEGALQADATLLARSVKIEDATSADGGSADAGDDHGGGHSDGGHDSDGGQGNDGGEGSDDGSRAGDLEFSGTVNAIAAGSITVGTTVVTANASTRIEKADQAVPISGIAAGDQVRVEGTLQADRSVLATEIKVLSAAEKSQVLVAGAVASIDAANKAFTIGTTAVKTSAATTFDGQGSFHSLADLLVGDLLDVQAAKQVDGSLVAISVHRLGKPDAGEVELKGAIEQLSATSLQVQGKTFAVDAATQIKSSGNTVAFGTLKVGQVAEVRGATAADGSLKATRISVESGH